MVRPKKKVGKRARKIFLSEHCRKIGKRNKKGNPSVIGLLSVECEAPSGICAADGGAGDDERVERKTCEENVSTACPDQQEAETCQQEAGTSEPKKRINRQKAETSQPEAGTCQPKAGRTRQAAETSQPKAGRTRQAAGTSQPKAGRTRQAAGTSQPKAGRTRQAAGTSQPNAGRRQEARTSSQHTSVPDPRPPASSLVANEITSSVLVALNEAALKVTLARIQANPQFYIGIPKNCDHIIDILHKQTRIPIVTILLCLKKVKLDTQFEELADQFGTTTSEASNLFTENLPVIAKSLQSFVTQEKVEKTNKPMSRPEEACVIDTLELNVEPNSTKSRELTQTERGNTVKYLIGCGTNGLINYVSPGYGGRQSYETLIEKTNYLERFKPGDSVIVNGFKNVEPIILRKGLKLLRPRRRSVLRVSKNTFLSEQLSDIERVVHRVREFIMVKDQSVISSELVSVLDEAVVISCALINLQSFLIN